MLSVDGLTVRVGARTIVDAVTFDARPGEIIAIIGPNGAGKTTLLEAMVGLRAADGRVRSGSAELSSFRERAATFAFAPDHVTPPPEVTVATLVAHAKHHRPRATFDQLCKGLGIDRLLARSPGVLSHGERKRVALFLALAADRPIVVLDEPFGAFDPLQLRDVLDVVRSVARSGVTVIVTVHQLADAERIADRVLLLADGRRIAFGSVDELRAGAATLEAAFVELLSRGRRAS
jgi:ABC-2 type transport system ATP-binding protein